jgi:hypothetical protein
LCESFPELDGTGLDDSDEPSVPIDDIESRWQRNRPLYDVNDGVVFGGSTVGNNPRMSLFTAQME